MPNIHRVRQRSSMYFGNPFVPDHPEIKVRRALPQEWFFVPVFSEICWCKAGKLGNLTQHARTNLLTLMESEFVIRPTFPDQNLMGTTLAIDPPPYPFQGG